MTQSIGISQVDGNLEIVARNASPELAAELASFAHTALFGAAYDTYIVLDQPVSRHYIERAARIAGLTVSL
jgi:hypothetical protein